MTTTNKGTTPRRGRGKQTVSADVLPPAPAGTAVLLTTPAPAGAPDASPLDPAPVKRAPRKRAAAPAADAPSALIAGLFQAPSEDARTTTRSKITVQDVRQRLGAGVVDALTRQGVPAARMPEQDALERDTVRMLVQGVSAAAREHAAALIAYADALDAGEGVDRVTLARSGKSAEVVKVKGYVQTRDAGYGATNLSTVVPGLVGDILRGMLPVPTAAEVSE